VFYWISHPFHAERNNVFTECYNLAFTQQKKKKDIPKGGSKAVILLEPYERFLSEEDMFKTELKNANLEPEQIEEKLIAYCKEWNLAR